MSEPSLAALMTLVAARRGHFRLESGHHGALWLDLDALFTNPRRVAPFVSALTDRIRGYDVDGVCGPLLGGAFLAQLVAHVLDVEFCYTRRTVPPDSEGLFPVQYTLPPMIGSRVAGKRFAIVDDVMSAGSALRGTCASLESHGGLPVVAAALLILGSTGADFFTGRGIPVEAAARDDYTLWTPPACPLCIDGMPIEDAPAG